MQCSDRRVNLDKKNVIQKKRMFKSKLATQQKAPKTIFYSGDRSRTRTRQSE